MTKKKKKTKNKTKKQNKKQNKKKKNKKRAKMLTVSAWCLPAAPSGNNQRARKHCMTLTFYF
jgi:hypothetical protein